MLDREDNGDDKILLLLGVVRKAFVVDGATNAANAATITDAVIRNIVTTILLFVNNDNIMTNLVSLLGLLLSSSMKRRMKQSVLAECWAESLRRCARCKLIVTR